MSLVTSAFTALLTFPLLALAAGGAADVWLKEGGPFDDWREEVLTWRSDPRWFWRNAGTLGECRMCCTHQAALWLGLLPVLLPLAGAGVFWLAVGLAQAVLAAFGVYFDWDSLLTASDAIWRLLGALACVPTLALAAARVSLRWLDPSEGRG